MCKTIQVTGISMLIIIFYHVIYIILAVWQYVIVIRVWVRAAAAFCLPARCEVGVPPWATATRKCLAVFKWGLGA